MGEHSKGRACLVAAAVMAVAACGDEVSDTYKQGAVRGQLAQ